MLGDARYVEPLEHLVSCWECATCPSEGEGVPYAVSPEAGTLKATRRLMKAARDDDDYGEFPDHSDDDKPASHQVVCLV